MCRASSTTSRKRRWPSARTLRQRKEEFDIWHPAECIGEAGAAAAPRSSRSPHDACAKGYSQGPQHPRALGQRQRTTRCAGAAVPGGIVSNKVYANSMEVSCKQARRQVDLRVPRRVLYAATDTSDAARRTRFHIQIQEWRRTHRGSSLCEDFRSGGDAQEQELLQEKHRRRSGAAPKKGVVTTHKTRARCTSMHGRWMSSAKARIQFASRPNDAQSQSSSRSDPPWPFAASQAVGSGKDPCETEKDNMESACGGKSQTEQCDSEACRTAQSCKLVPSWCFRQSELPMRRDRAPHD